MRYITQFRNLLDPPQLGGHQQPLISSHFYNYHGRFGMEYLDLVLQHGCCSTAGKKHTLRNAPKNKIRCRNSILSISPASLWKRTKLRGTGCPTWAFNRSPYGGGVDFRLPQWHQVAPYQAGQPFSETFLGIPKRFEGWKTWFLQTFITWFWIIPKIWWYI